MTVPDLDCPGSPVTDRSVGAPDLLVTGGLILTLEEGREPIPDGYVAVKNGAIVATGPAAEAPAGAARVIEARGGLVMPGLVNTHCHAAMSLFRGLADDLPLMTWLNDYIFPAEANWVDDRLAYWGAKLAAAEMLLSGTTTVADAYFRMDQVARAFQETGLRAVVGQGVIDFPAPGVPDPATNIATAERFVCQWDHADPLILPAVFCHSPYTCQPETLLRAKDLARRRGLLFGIHVAETLAEVAEVRKAQGMTPVRYLNSLGLLDELTLAVHCVHLDQDEIDLLVDRGVAVSACLESNMKLGSGMTPVPNMLAKGLRLGLGTDGPASNNDLNMFGEMRSMALFFKGLTLDPTTLPARQALGLASFGGAATLGLGHLIGTLAPGRRADMIVLDIDQPHLRPMYNPYSHLVYAATGREIRTVIVDGRIVVENRHPTLFDLDETMAEAREMASRIKS